MLVVRPVHWLKRNKFWWIGREIIHMLLFVPFWIASKLKLVQCTWKGNNNPPGSCERMHQFINPSVFRIGTGGTLSKYDVANGKNTWVVLTRAYQFAVPTLLFFDKELFNFAAR